jgi:hypothetical protein
MIAQLALIAAPVLAILFLIILVLVNRSKAQRLALGNSALKAAAGAAHRNIKRRQMLDADLEQLHKQHRQENIDAQTPGTDRTDFDNNWMPGAGAAGNHPDAGPAALARAPGPAGDQGPRAGLSEW